MSARAFWVRIALTTAIAFCLALALSPPAPQARVGPALAAAAGLAGGAVLFVAAARRLPGALFPSPVAVARQAVLALCAANEEVVWRRVALGELLPAGALVALAAATVGFAAAHRRSRRLHLATGATFGGLYLLTGALVASIAAHWLYNASVASVGRAPP